MGYEQLERESLITLRFALELAMRRIKLIREYNRQMYSDMNYELQRINEFLLS